MEPVIVIVGPTASGKTKLSIELAKEIDGEIISADSMQVYKYMDIGTAKPDAEEMSGIKHYLIDEINPDEEFNVARFRDMALKYISQIIGKSKHPIIVGGTGLYINSLIYNISFSETISDWDYREELKNEAIEKGNSFLYEKLKGIDPEAAEKIHENDIKRIIRALEVFKHTNKTMTFHQQQSRLEPPPYRYIVYGLCMDREKLYCRIEKRVDTMLEKGLIAEVKKLYDMGYDKKTVAMQGLGYKEVLCYLRGEATLEETENIIKRNTRRYAKRQLTWFRRSEDVNWLDTDENTDFTDVVKNIKYHIASSGIIL